MTTNSVQIESGPPFLTVLFDSYAHGGNRGTDIFIESMEAIYSPQASCDWVSFLEGSKRMTCGLNSSSFGATIYGYTLAQSGDVSHRQILSATENPFDNDFLLGNPAVMRIREIARLEDDWNGNGAKRFSRALLAKVYDMLKPFLGPPLVFPTACDSIQFEYEKDDGEYLEFEIFEDKTKVFRIDKDGCETEWVLFPWEEHKVKELANDFYTKNG